MNGNYEKPVIMLDNEQAEGVYMASGDSTTDSSGCYTATALIHQTPETGRGDYRIQVDGKHAADHHSNIQVLHLHFNMPVFYKSSNGYCLSGDGTAKLDIQYKYHNNANDSIGLGDVVVQAESGLAVTRVSITDDNGRCATHDGCDHGGPYY